MQSTLYLFCLSDFLTVCLSVTLSVCLSFCLLSVCRSDLCLSVSLYFGLSLHLSRCLSLFLSMSVSLHVFPSVRLTISVDQSISLSVLETNFFTLFPRCHNMETDNVTNFVTLFLCPQWPLMVQRLGKAAWILKRLREVPGRMGGLQRPENTFGTESRIWASKLWLGSLHPYCTYLHIQTPKNVQEEQYIYGTVYSNACFI